MILHLLDDDKFADYAIEQFSSISQEQNKFIVFVPDRKDKIINIINHNQIEPIACRSNEFSVLCRNLGDYKAIITHNLFTPEKEQIIASAPEQVKTAWVFWGGELYSRREFIGKYLGKQTTLLHLQYRFKQTIKRILFPVLKGKKYLPSFEPSKEIFKKLDYCLSDINEDFEMAGKLFKSKFKHLWYNYYSIEETVGSLWNATITGNNILLGNSATLTNNHLEAFQLIKKLELKGRKIITPLSYGDKPYLNTFLHFGRKQLGEHFEPLLDFMEREEYNRKLLSCSIVIMNHYRPQALGNIITTLWLGAKVYLSERNLIYSYLKRLGVHIYSVEADLKPSNKLALEPLHPDKVAANRAVLLAEYGKETVLNRVRELVNTLNN